MPSISRPVKFLLVFGLAVTAVFAVAQEQMTAAPAEPAAQALQFVPVPPCRVVDTRNQNGTFGGPPIQGGTARSFRSENDCSAGRPRRPGAAIRSSSSVPGGGHAKSKWNFWRPANSRRYGQEFPYLTEPHLPYSPRRHRLFIKCLGGANGTFGIPDGMAHGTVAASDCHLEFTGRTDQSQCRHRGGRQWWRRG